MAPSVRSLQLLINKISLPFDEHFLKINVQKTVLMCFKRTRNCVPKNLKFYFKGHELTVVNNFKYLGCVLTSDLNDSFDIDRCSLSFTKSFGFLFRKFKSINIDIFLMLFHSYCTSFCGSELWISRKKASRNFKQLGFLYHKS